MSRTRRRRDKKQLTLKTFKERLEQLKKKQPRNALTVAMVTGGRNGSGSHGDERKEKSRNACRKWKRNKHWRDDY